MLRTLALISQKGGSGKTTLALALAAAHELGGGQAAVIDLDPQGSATVWGRLREGVPPVVIAAHPPVLRPRSGAWPPCPFECGSHRVQGLRLVVITVIPAPSATGEMSSDLVSKVYKLDSLLLEPFMDTCLPHRLRSHQRRLHIGAVRYRSPPPPLSLSLSLSLRQVQTAASGMIFCS